MGFSAPWLRVQGVYGAYVGFMVENTGLISAMCTPEYFPVLSRAMLV